MEAATDEAAAVADEAAAETPVETEVATDEAAAATDEAAAATPVETEVATDEAAAATDEAAAATDEAAAATDEVQAGAATAKPKSKPTWGINNTLVGLHGWTYSAEDGQHAWTSPDGSTRVQDSGPGTKGRYQVFQKNPDTGEFTPLSAHGTQVDLKAELGLDTADVAAEPETEEEIIPETDAAKADVLAAAGDVAKQNDEIEDIKRLVQKTSYGSKECKEASSR